ncbi:DUF2164 domain-containing protein [Mangrovibacillus cuniculi]|uniref:DUF2164 domain-containing protein n=1 Tax=Mangrovibacillus cuniculi TaxID=2593652 RepID=A0A7S8CDQ8_9BACI|nr:DUF2164 domain-containing protein [Mangrovibacillus cuniculi]QPC48090.1 DUF2164 domain-containing protein [Mangrovibacillus cuniculi]
MIIIKLEKEKKQQIVEELKEWFYQERAEELGDIGAENMMEFFLQEIGPYFYNQGVKDARKLMQENVSQLEDDLISLERRKR